MELDRSAPARREACPTLRTGQQTWRDLLFLHSSNAELHVRWTPEGQRLPAARLGTLEHFLTERYALYGPARSGGVYRVRVHHKPWPTSRARIEHLATTIPEAAGLAVGDPIDLVLASDAGVAVETFARERVTP